MRADMKKVFCERPRRGGYYTYHDFRHRQTHGDWDNLSSHEGMRKPYGYDNKHFDDLIGPLRRYLHRSVGRLWNDVWSEICQQTPSSNTIDKHLRDHVKWMVEVNCIVENDDRVYGKPRRYRTLAEVDGLYVDPRDGLLCVAADRPRRAYGKPVVIDGLRYRLKDDGLLYPIGAARFRLKMVGDQKAMLINGIWYWIEMAVTPPSRLVQYIEAGMIRHRRVYSARQDFVTGEFVQEGRYHADKRQMTSRDLHRNGLRNIR